MPLAARLASPSVVAATGLVGGFALGRAVGKREVGGVAFALAGAWCARQWARSAGPVAAAGLSAGYVGAMGVSHPLATKIGTWPSVLAVTAAVVAASEVVGRR